VLQLKQHKNRVTYSNKIAIEWSQTSQNNWCLDQAKVLYIIEFNAPPPTPTHPKKENKSLKKGWGDLKENIMKGICLNEVLKITITNKQILDN